MSVRARAWRLMRPSAPLERQEIDLAPGPRDVIVEVAGCGVCHTDLGFLFGGVRTRRPLPLTLGHEIAGTVVEAGPEANLQSGEALRAGATVVIPAVLPCGDCPVCGSGRENICPAQKMPGNDLDGGFASHVQVPARFLVQVEGLPAGHDLADLSVVADAVTTPYQALLRAAVGPGDRVVVIGTGGIGIYGVQIAAAWGARVLAIDLLESRARRACQFGAELGVATQGLDDDGAREAVRSAAKGAGWAPEGWKVLEMSGSAPGQRLAFALLNRGGTLGVVGFTRDKIEVRLSNLMAFDADAFGSWGCSPRHYPAVLTLVREGKVKLRPFISRHPLDQVVDVLERAHHGGLETRPVLVPGMRS
jgi:6-hydroxycyclohex-1-ene-1-carbonyl-CoA dehydrogenase